MRPRIRLGILIAIVAALAIGLARVADTWKRGEFDYQRKHASEASGWGRRSSDLYFRIEALKTHRGHTASCPVCQSLPKPLAVILAEMERDKAHASAMYKEHARQAGPAAMRRLPPFVK